VRSLHRAHGAAAEEVWIVDLHTGLGTFGACTLLSNHGAASAEHAALRARFAGERLEVTEGNADRVTAEKHGLLPRGVAEEMPHASVRAVTFELGTHDPQRILMAERHENWLHHHGDRGSARGRAIAWEHRECSCPDSSPWREAALAHGARVLDLALEAVSD
jgi:hypothetical protein